MNSRYLFRSTPTTKFLETGFATRDYAVAWAVRFSKQAASLLVYDTHESPHRLVGKAEKGCWRPPVARCKSCEGRGWKKPSGDPCQDCESMGAVLEAMPWQS